MDIVTRSQGSLLGLACGDAVGTVVEFKHRNHFLPVTDMLGGGVFRLEKGQWTDDTSMALCLADSLVNCQDFDPTDQMNCYLRWYQYGYNSSTGACFDIGRATLSALQRFIHSQNPYAGSTDPYSSGNGSLMRLAPIPIFYHQDIEKTVKYAVLSSKTTHASADCLSACAYFSQVVWQALYGEQDKNQLFKPLIHYEWSKNIQPILAGDFKQKSRDEIFGTGYVINSLEASLWCFYHTNSFKEAILMATNLGDDADTTSAICGQIAGAYYGLDGIPDDWQQNVFWAKHILDLTNQLLKHSST